MSLWETSTVAIKRTRRPSPAERLRARKAARAEAARWKATMDWAQRWHLVQEFGRTMGYLPPSRGTTHGELMRMHDEAERGA